MQGAARKNHLRHPQAHIKIQIFTTALPFNPQFSTYTRSNCGPSSGHSTLKQQACHKISK
jgi:hypothetical protein